METVDFALAEVKFADAQEGTFIGTAITFNSPISHFAYGSDIVKPGAFRKTLAAKGPAGIKMLWQHDTAEPVGKWLSLQESTDGLQVRGQLLLELPKAREARTLLQADVVDGLSVGFNVPPGGAAIDAQKRVRTISEIDLYEVSLVTFPADVQARVREVKAHHATMAQLLEEIRQVRRLLRSGR